jgi:hypothetical protein
MTSEQGHIVIETNLNSLFHVTKQVIDDSLDRGWGRIINVSSVNGQKGQLGQSNYSTAKARNHGFTMALAREVAAKGVTVNAVSPGYIGTDMVRAVKPEVLEKIVASIPVRRLGTPEKVASIIAWLASDESGFATGADASRGCTVVFRATLLPGAVRPVHAVVLPCARQSRRHAEGRQDGREEGRSWRDATASWSQCPEHSQGRPATLDPWIPGPAGSQPAGQRTTG